MLATYVDQIVVEERMAEIEREAARLHLQSQRPDRQKTAFAPQTEEAELGRGMTGKHATTAARQKPGRQETEVLS